jgi:hypothetical protein
MHNNLKHPWNITYVEIWGRKTQARGTGEKKQSYRTKCERRGLLLCLFTINKEFLINDIL